MVATEKSLFELTAADLQSRVAVRLTEGMPLPEAARALLDAGVRGAPVVDGTGRLTGVLSVSDLARWAARRDGPAPARPKSCGHQRVHRSVRGRETTLCALPAESCSFQHPERLADGRVAQACAEPNCVCLEWQMVEMEALPVEDVRHYMTADPVTADPGTPITALARRMLDAAVERVVVVDPDRRPVGVVSATDLVAALAEADGGSPPA